MPTQHSTPAQTELLTLPRELRDQIYSYKGRSLHPTDSADVCLHPTARLSENLSHNLLTLPDQCRRLLLDFAIEDLPVLELQLVNRQMRSEYLEAKAREASVQISLRYINRYWDSLTWSRVETIIGLLKKLQHYQFFFSLAEKGEIRMDEAASTALSSMDRSMESLSGT
ncbi:hypothetical protein K432DRAFT_411020 [Lepidopterella palustris CBS 459.81]|uniref:F-box domain-containing protein n=1 Tax=Lepidopterella palustris CBS 459.81 TaxID=1314670 RepID=A0A8E2J8D6_9PEZI|nr:hypothetical protein K432DRAFT_411020 [Lepidopterella palustris CBS 459.81]